MLSLFPGVLVGQVVEALGVFRVSVGGSPWRTLRGRSLQAGPTWRAGLLAVACLRAPAAGGGVSEFSGPLGGLGAGAGAGGGGWGVTETYESACVCLLRSKYVFVIERRSLCFANTYSAASSKDTVVYCLA